MEEEKDKIYDWMEAPDLLPDEITSLSIDESTSTYNSIIRGQSSKKVDEGCHSVTSLQHKLNVNPVNAEVDTSKLVQWTNKELVQAERTKMRVRKKQRLDEDRLSRRTIRELEGKPAFIVNDTRCKEGLVAILDDALNGNKPNVTASMRDKVGASYKIALDSHYLKRDDVSLAAKVLKLVDWHPVAKALIESDLPIAGLRQYRKLGKGTLREAISGLLRIYSMVIKWRRMEEQLADHEIRITQLEKGILETKHKTRPIDELKEKAKVMRSQGMSYADIAAELGRSKQAVSKWFK